VKTLRKWTKHTEFYLLGTVILLSIIVELRSGQFFTGNNLVDLARSFIVPAMFAIGAHIVIISGGIDVSFPAIASLAMFATTKLFLDANYTGSVVWIYVVGALFGLVLGSVNGNLIARFKFPTLIVTLGTSSLFTGILLGPLAAHEIRVPEPMFNLGKAKLFTVQRTARLRFRHAGDDAAVLRAAYHRLRADALHDAGARHLRGGGR